MGNGSLTPNAWAGIAEDLRVEWFAKGFRYNPAVLGLDAAELAGVEAEDVLNHIEMGTDQGLLDIQLGRPLTVFHDPWANMAASLARTWARLE